MNVVHSSFARSDVFAEEQRLSRSTIQRVHAPSGLVTDQIVSRSAFAVALLANETESTKLVGRCSRRETQQDRHPRGLAYL